MWIKINQIPIQVSDVAAISPVQTLNKEELINCGSFKNKLLNDIRNSNRYSKQQAENEYNRLNKTFISFMQNVFYSNIDELSDNSYYFIVYCKGSSLKALMDNKKYIIFNDGIVSPFYKDEEEAQTALDLLLNTMNDMEHN